MLFRKKQVQHKAKHETDEGHTAVCTQNQTFSGPVEPRGTNSHFKKEVCLWANRWTERGSERDNESKHEWAQSAHSSMVLICLIAKSWKFLLLSKDVYTSTTVLMSIIRELNIDTEYYYREKGHQHTKSSSIWKVSFISLSLPLLITLTNVGTNLQSSHLCLLANLMVHLLQLHAQLLLPLSWGQLFSMTSHIWHGQSLPLRSQKQWEVKRLKIIIIELVQKERDKKEDLRKRQKKKKKVEHFYLSLKRPWEGIFWWGEYGEPPQPPWVP